MNLVAGLRKKGINARGEVGGFILDRISKTRKHVRFDIVCFEGKEPVLIIEVKRMHAPKKGQWAQMQKYRKFGIRVVSITGMEKAKEFLKTM